MGKASSDGAAIKCCQSANYALIIPNLVLDMHKLTNLEHFGKTRTSRGTWVRSPTPPTPPQKFSKKSSIFEKTGFPNTVALAK